MTDHPTDETPIERAYRLEQQGVQVDWDAVSKLPAAELGAKQGAPRDVLVDRISTWVDNDDNIYRFADRLILDLYNAGYEIVRREDR